MMYYREGSHTPPTAATLATVTSALEAERAPSWQSRGVTSTLPSFVVADLGVDLDLSGKGKLRFYQLTDHLCLQCLKRVREPRPRQRGCPLHPLGLHGCIT